MRPRKGVHATLQVVICAVAFLRAAEAQNGLVRGDTLEFVNTLDGSSYAVRPNTVIAGEILEQAQEPTLLACAELCAAYQGADEHVKCDSFNYCDVKGGCLEKTSASSLKRDTCQLLVSASAGGIGVFQLAADQPQLGSGGVRMDMSLVDLYEPEGYEAFLGRSHNEEYDLTCPDSIVPLLNKCILPSTIQEAADRCNAWAECLAFVYTHKGPGEFNFSMATFKGSPSGEKIDFATSFLTRGAVTFVKEGWYVPLTGDAHPAALPGEMNGTDPTSSAGSSSLSGGAIAGIVVGALCGAALVVGAVLVWWRRKRKNLSPSSGKLADGTTDLESSQGQQQQHGYGTGDSGGSSGLLSPAAAFAAAAALTAAAAAAAGSGRGNKEGSRRGGSVRSGSVRGGNCSGLKPSAQGGSVRGGNSSGLKPSGLGGAAAGANCGPLVPYSDPSSGMGFSSGNSEMSLIPEGSRELDKVKIEVPTPQWEDVMIPRDAIEMCRNAQGEFIKLGSGASGDVYRVVLHGATLCACKVYHFGNHANSKKRFMQEACMLWRIHSYCHPNVVGFLGASMGESEGLLLMEWMAGGDLHDALKTQLPDGKGRLFSWYNRGRRAALQVAVGLAYLHRHKIVHLDLKPRNVLLSRDGNCKIGDVGFSRILNSEFLSQLSSQFGTFDYCAPEVLLGEQASEKADIYSYGILLWQMCTGQMPKRGDLRMLRAPEECPPEVANMQQCCVATDPAERPSAGEIVEILRNLQRAAAARASVDRSVRGPMDRAASTPVPASVGLAAVAQAQAQRASGSGGVGSGGVGSGGVTTGGGGGGGSGSDGHMQHQHQIRSVHIGQPPPSAMTSPLLMQLQQGQSPLMAMVSRTTATLPAPPPVRAGSHRMSQDGGYLLREPSSPSGPPLVRSSAPGAAAVPAAARPPPHVPHFRSDFFTPGVDAPASSPPNGSKVGSVQEVASVSEDPSSTVDLQLSSGATTAGGQHSGGSLGGHP